MQVVTTKTTMLCPATRPIARPFTAIRPVGRLQHVLQARQCLDSQSRRKARAPQAIPPGAAEQLTAAASPADRAGCSPSTWEQFALKVSGEWEGVTASFSPEGQPLQLPEYYVPEAYREWGVELFDWQTQCSCQADAQQFNCTVRRMMPTVGCEADAIAYTEAASSTSNDEQHLAVHSCGSYSAGPLTLPDTVGKFSIEACLALGDGKLRFKVVHNMLRNWQDKTWTLNNVELHKEVYDGPYTGRKELAGCGGGQPAISKQPPVTQHQVVADWTAASVVEYQFDGTAVTMKNSDSRNAR
eukprot:jgi/Chrzof1/12867/Cz07g10080.t1